MALKDGEYPWWYAGDVSDAVKARIGRDFKFESDLAEGNPERKKMLGILDDIVKDKFYYGILADKFNKDDYNDRWQSKPISAFNKWFVEKRSRYLLPDSRWQGEGNEFNGFFADFDGYDLARNGMVQIYNDTGSIWGCDFKSKKDKEDFIKCAWNEKKETFNPVGCDSKFECEPIIDDEPRLSWLAGRNLIAARDRLKEPRRYAEGICFDDGYPEYAGWRSFALNGQTRAQAEKAIHDPNPGPGKMETGTCILI